jgi:hypothetical protein
MTDCRRSMRERWCFACGTPVPEEAGVAHMGLNILIHQGRCSTTVDQEMRMYDRSPRGRWRPTREVLARVRPLRAARTQEVSA